MRIVFMGTPDFAVPTLTALISSGHEVGIVVSQPDAMRDRGKKVKHTPVKEKALEHSLKILQPEKIKENKEFIETIKNYSPDVIVVVAYGKILPKEILSIPKQGCINVHGSLLPKYRGAAPIQRAILEGEEKTGITIMYMEEGLDTGDMLAKKTVEIGKKSGGYLHDELSRIGAKLLIETLDKLEKREAKPEKQNEDSATYAPMIFKKNGEIDFEKKAVEIERQVRALDPWPGAFTYYKGELFKIWEADVIDIKYKGKLGEILHVSDEGIQIGTGKGVLVAKVIQLPGKKRRKVEDFLKGNNIDIGEILG